MPRSSLSSGASWNHNLQAGATSARMRGLFFFGNERTMMNDQAREQGQWRSEGYRMRVGDERSCVAKTAATLQARLSALSRRGRSRTQTRHHKRAHRDKHRGFKMSG